MNPKINSYPNINKTAHLSTEELFGTCLASCTQYIIPLFYKIPTTCTHVPNGMVINKNKNSRLMMQPNLLFKTKFVYMINKENKIIYV